MRIPFNDTVGTVLTISSAISVIQSPFRYGERAIQSPHSKLTNIGSMMRPAPAGAGAPTKKLALHGGGGSPLSWVLKRASRNAQQTAKNSTIAQPMLCHCAIVHR